MRGGGGGDEETTGGVGVKKQRGGERVDKE